MKMYARWILTVVAALSNFSAHALPQPADLVFKDGYIYTVDANNPVAQGLAVRQGKIVYLGDSAGALTYAGEQTKIVDLAGAFMLPGFIDSHMHPFLAATAASIQFSLPDPYAPVADILTEIKKYVADHPELTFIEISGYQRATFIAERGTPPNKHDLDAIDSVRPIFVLELNGHSAWVNSKALEIAGIDANSADPAGGVIERLPGTQEPNGQLLEEAAYMVLQHFPLPTQAQIIAALRAQKEYLASRGLTTIHDMYPAMTVKRQIAMHAAANVMANAGELNLRFIGSWPVNPFHGEPTQQIREFIRLSKTYSHPHFQVPAFKFMVDGIIEERSAFLSTNYCDAVAPTRAECLGQHNGHDLWAESGQDLSKAYRQINGAGFQINNHVIGDAAVSKVLDAIEAAQVPREMRPSLEHIQIAKPADVARMGRLGVSANVTPMWMGLDSYFSTFYYPALGFERAYNDTYPYRSLMDAGVNVTMSSDWPVSEPDVQFGMFTALTRLYPQRVYDQFYGYSDESILLYPYTPDLGKIYEVSDFDPVNFSVMPIGPLPPASERGPSIETVIETATINGAKANRIDHITGSIEVGKMADLVVLDTNLIAVFNIFRRSGQVADLEPVANAQILATYFEGRQVYERAGPAPKGKSRRR